jgi:16S rRNA (cytosine1402-N4)-methyltransferase
MAADLEGHTPVLYGETLELLKLQKGQTIVDGTLGGAGHARGILESITPGGTLVGIDQDADAIERCAKRLEDYRDSVRLARDDFKNITAVLDGLGIDGIDGALLDLGVSSFQLDECERGFSYNADAPLDMRMDKNNGLDAAYVVNGYKQEELARIIREYGEERWAARIAEFIVKNRIQENIETTGQLVRIIKQAIPKGARSGGPHPAKRTFQAIRIEVNGELNGLGQAMEDYARVMKRGGRLAVITFHSLEDRIVKQAFRRLHDPCECPKDLPVCVCGKEKMAEIITRRPVRPDDRELKENPRARSAKLRVIEKV